MPTYTLLISTTRRSSVASSSSRRSFVYAAVLTQLLLSVTLFPPSALSPPSSLSSTHQQKLITTTTPFFFPFSSNLLTYASAGPAPAAATNVGTTTTSTFSVDCPGAGTIPSLAWAIDTCHTKGGWLATPQSLDDDIMLRNLVNAVTGVPSDYLLIGGSDAWLEAHWVWIDGPELGRMFWAGDMPNANGQVIGHRYVPPNKFYAEKDGTGSTGDWMVQFGSSTNILWGDIAHFGTTQCYACQYQRCSILCNTTHTASITGTWWPDCVCTCKPGWRGERCDIQFSSHCTADSSAIGSTAGPIADCKARGGYLASPRSRDDDDAIVSLGNVSATSYLLMDGTDEMKESFWRFADGPFKDQLFWVGDSVAEGGGPAKPAPWETAHYSYFNDVEPQPPTDTWTGNFTILWERKISDTVPSLYVWGDFPIVTSRVRCYACQYAHCSQICNTTNTIFVSDTEWPACTCTCKAGWGGPRCSEKLIETPTSNISVRCPMEGGIPDQEWAIDRCHSYGGWLATPQRAEEYEAILAFANMYSDNPISKNFTLLGGSDAWYETHWVWRDGPEIGRQFWLGNLPSYFRVNGTGHPIAGRYSPPLFLPEEANTGTGTPGDLMVFGPHPTYNYTVGDLGDGNWNISIVQCYACMFQLCSNVCNTTHTASFTGEVWPDCVCTCKPGWRGERCDIQFSTHCTADHSTIGDLVGPIADCRARGGHLASPQNHVQDDSLQSLGNISSVTFLVIGGSDEVEEGVWRWLDGPEKGEVFWRGYSPDTGYTPLPAYPWVAGNNTYANFAPNEPQAPDSPYTGNYTVYWQRGFEFLWGDYRMTTSRTSCYACQYTACVDYCNATTTASFTGLEWPSCSCTCLPGFAGPKCQCVDQCHALGTLSTYLNYTDQYCGCVCAPNFGGTFCNITTATPTMTSTLPTTSTTSASLTTTAITSTTNSLDATSTTTMSLSHPPTATMPMTPTTSITNSLPSTTTPTLPFTTTNSASISAGTATPSSLTSITASQPTTDTPSFTLGTSTPTTSAPLTATTSKTHESPTTSHQSTASDPLTITKKTGSSSPTLPTSLTSDITTTRGTNTDSRTVPTTMTKTIPSSPTSSLALTSTYTAPTHTGTTTLTLSKTKSVSPRSPSASLSQPITASPPYSSTHSMTTSHAPSNTLSSPLTPITDRTSVTTSPSPSTSRHKMSQTVQPPTAAPPNNNTVNATLLDLVSASLPLSAPIRLTDANVVQGSETIIVSSQPLDGLLAILGMWSGRSFATASIMSDHSVPIVSMKPRSSGSVSGNTNGYFATQPASVRVTVNATHALLSMSAVDTYSIDAEETLELHTTLRAVYGGSSLLTDETATLDLDAPIVVMTVVAVPSSTMGEGTLPTTTTVVAGGGGFSGMASEVQALGAFAMMGCSDPRTRSNFGSYRVLAPTALFESYSGVVLGNAALVVGVAAVQLVVLGLLRACRSVPRLIDHMATCMFPSLTLVAASAFHVGTAFASSQLVSEPYKFDAWEVAVGAVGMVYCVLYPLLLTLHPYLRIERAYQEYEMAEWLSAAKKWPAFVRFLIPRGAIFSSETRRAYGPAYISSIRLPARQVWWVSMPAWTGSIVAVGGLIHPVTVPHCQALFITMGIVLIATGVIVVAFRPLRADVASVLIGASRAFCGAALLCMAAALNANGPTDAASLTAILAIGIVLMVVAVLRIVFALVGWYVEYRMNSDNVPLSLVWTHIPGSSNKTTQQFTVAGDQEMLVVADIRDDNEKDVVSEGENSRTNSFDDIVSCEMVSDESISGASDVNTLPANCGKPRETSTPATLDDSFSDETGIVFKDPPKKNKQTRHPSVVSVEGDENSSSIHLSNDSLSSSSASASISLLHSSLSVDEATAEDFSSVTGSGSDSSKSFSDDVL